MVPRLWHCRNDRRLCFRYRGAVDILADGRLLATYNVTPEKSSDVDLSIAGVMTITFRATCSGNSENYNITENHAAWANPILHK